MASPSQQEVSLVEGIGRWTGAERETDKNANARSADNHRFEYLAPKKGRISRIKKRSYPARKPLCVQRHDVQPSECRPYVLHAMVLHAAAATFG
jgi:hypothetical protein